MKEAAESCLEEGHDQVGLLQPALATPHWPLARSLLACFSSRAPRGAGFLALAKGQTGTGSAF